MTQKTVLGLKLPTDPRWADLAKYNIEEILSDHAWCEQKAASTCISLIVQYPDHREMVEMLNPLVTEEWGHFRMVMRELDKRHLQLGRQRKDEYVNELMKNIRKGRKESLMDKLLVAALIEARSCERFRILSQSINDDELKRFYHDLMTAEAGHYRLFKDLAVDVAGEETASKRWDELLEIEGDIMKTISVRGDRMH
jgi:tRNA-(ms[2]io[6]A)-hydroxylase